MANLFDEFQAYRRIQMLLKIIFPNKCFITSVTLMVWRTVGQRVLPQAAQLREPGRLNEKQRTEIGGIF